MKKQMYSSAATSINCSKLPAVYGNKAVLKALQEAGRFTLTDFGAGKFDNAKNFVESTFGGQVYTYDKYNRTAQENGAALAVNADFGIISNVLNVIDSADARRELLELAKSHARTVYITVYEGNGSGIGKVSKSDCWQENRKTADYLQEVGQVFETVTIKGKLIIAQ